jgi:hypothetical protein
MNKDMELDEAVKKACQKMEGSWGLLVMHKDFED